MVADPGRLGESERWVEAEDAVAGLVERFALDAGAHGRLRALLRLVAEDPHAPTSVRGPRDVVERHLADSLVALELDPVRAAASVVDIGAGAGFPGLALAIARPEARFTLLESNGRKSQFLAGAIAACEADNVSVVNARAEDWPDGRGRFALATARAVAGLDVVIEYAAPFLAVGGHLVVWRGHRDAEAEAAAARAAELLGMRIEEIDQMRPFHGAEARYLHLISKVMETPPGFPRRTGVAAKRPLGAR